MKQNKVKNWVKEHKNEIVCTVGVVTVGVTGYCLGKIYTRFVDACSMALLHDEGYIKCFNPKTGLEITVGELNKLL